MLKCNMEMVREYQLSLDDLVLISAIELFANEKDLDNDNKFDMQYSELIESLPILFNSSERSNIAKLRKFLNRESIKHFVTRDITQQGRAKGAKVTFTINRHEVNKLNVKGLIN